jgi:hypothetical protein
VLAKILRCFSNFNSFSKLLSLLLQLDSTQFFIPSNPGVFNRLIGCVIINKGNSNSSLPLASVTYKDNVLLLTCSARSSLEKIPLNFSTIDLKNFGCFLPDFTAFYIFIVEASSSANSDVLIM